MKPVIDLCWGDHFGLILPWASGVLFTNQTAGHACEHPKMEGVFVPLDDGEGRPTRTALARHFQGSWISLTGEDADIIDRALRAGNLEFVCVDRSQLAFSKEAWVRVKLDLAAASDLVSNFSSPDAILTWENSD